LFVFLKSLLCLSGFEEYSGSFHLRIFTYFL